MKTGKFDQDKEEIIDNISKKKKDKKKNSEKEVPGVSAQKPAD